MNNDNWTSAFRILFQWPFLTTTDVSEWIGLSVRKVLMLVEQGLVHPESDSPGRGKARRYSLTELLTFLIFSKLDDFGIAPRYLRSIAPDVNKIVRARISVGDERPSLLFILKDEDAKLRVLVGDDPSHFQDITILIHLRAIELELLNTFKKKAPLSEDGIALLRMVGREYDSDGIEKMIKEWAAGKGEEGK